MAKRISLDEAKVRANHLARRRIMLELQRDGDYKYYEAAVLVADAAQADEYRRKLHEALDEYLDTVAEFQTLVRIVDA